MDPAYVERAAKGHELSAMALLLADARQAAEFGSFAEVFHYFKQEGADFGAKGHVSGEDLVADSPDAANPFPGVLTGQRYGRLMTWPSDVPPGRVPLLWGLEDLRGRFRVVFLDGNCGILEREALERAIDRLQKYGPVRRWQDSAWPPSAERP